MKTEPTEAFIENTAEAREWLHQMGYKACPCVIDDPSDHIVTGNDGRYHCYDKDTFADFLAEREDTGGDEVDCRGDLTLFKAIIAESKKKCPVCNGRKTVPKFDEWDGKLRGSTKCWICNGGVYPDYSMDY